MLKVNIRFFIRQCITWEYRETVIHGYGQMGGMLHVTCIGREKLRNCTNNEAYIAIRTAKRIDLPSCSMFPGGATGLFCRLCTFGVLGWSLVRL